MALESIGMAPVRARDRTGNPVSEGSEIPVFRGAKLSVRQMLRRLDGALDSLASTPCSFWMCNGPKHVRAMCTCCKCYAMRDVAVVRAALARRMQ